VCIYSLIWRLELEAVGVIMILSLLKNRGLRLQLFLGLLLAAGTLPKGSEGLECMDCNKDTKIHPCKAKKTCAADEVCVERLDSESQTLGCFLKTVADCVKQRKW